MIAKKSAVFIFVIVLIISLIACQKNTLNENIYETKVPNIDIFVIEGFKTSEEVPVIVTFVTEEDKEKFLASFYTEDFKLYGEMQYTPSAVYGNLSLNGFNILKQNQKVKSIFTYGLFIDGEVRPYPTDKLGIFFSQQMKNSINATSSFIEQKTKRNDPNAEFRVFFQKELKVILSPIHVVKNVEVEWFQGKIASITILYGANISEEDKIKTLMEIKTLLNLEWYVERTVEHIS